MKKEYVKPAVEIVEIESQCILQESCPSFQGGEIETGGCEGDLCDD